MLDELVERAAEPGHRDLAVGVKSRQQLIPAALVAIEPPGLDQLGAGEFVFQTHLFPDSHVVWRNKFLGGTKFLGCPNAWVPKRRTEGRLHPGPSLRDDASLLHDLGKQRLVLGKPSHDDVS